MTKTNGDGEVLRPLTAEDALAILKEQEEGTQFSYERCTASMSEAVFAALVVDLLRATPPPNVNRARWCAYVGATAAQATQSAVLAACVMPPSAAEGERFLAMLREYALTAPTGGQPPWDGPADRGGPGNPGEGGDEGGPRNGGAPVKR